MILLAMVGMIHATISLALAVRCISFCLDISFTLIIAVVVITGICTSFASFLCLCFSYPNLLFSQSTS